MAPPNGHSQKRQELAQQWLCKWCTHPSTGQRWWNHADKKECGSCAQPKGLVFFGPMPPPGGSGSPSVSGKQKANMERKAAAEAERSKSALQEKGREIARLKEQLAAKRGQPDAMDVDAEPTEPDAQAALAELAAATQAIGSPSDPILVKAKQDMVQQQATLRAKMLPDKPIGAKLHRKQIAEAEAAVEATSRELAVVEAVRAAAASQAPLPKPGVHSLRAAIPCLDMDVGALGQLLQGLGADGSLAESASKNFEELRKLGRA
ncbi:unnamed protein product, partial [Prorocentrum cordatum]